MKNMVKLSLDEYKTMSPDEVYNWYKEKMSPVSRDEMAKMDINLRWFDIVNREEGCVVMINENGEPELFGTYDNGDPILPLKPRGLYNNPDVEVGVDNINKSLKESVEQLIFFGGVDEAGERITHKEGGRIKMTRNELISKTANTIISDITICKDTDRMGTLLGKFVNEHYKNGYSDRYASEDWQRALKNVAVKLNGTTYSDKVHTAQTHLAEIRYWRNKV